MSKPTREEVRAEIRRHMECPVEDGHCTRCEHRTDAILEGLDALELAQDGYSDAG